jgi:hypothetical protein
MYPCLAAAVTCTSYTSWCFGLIFMTDFTTSRWYRVSLHNIMSTVGL